jgi:hypothetical protein
LTWILDRKYNKGTKMIQMKKTLISAAVAVVLAGCGGGGNFLTQPTGITTGKAIDGYISGASVVCDADGNGAFTAGETVVITNATGDFTFSSACKDALISFGGNNIDTGLPFTGIIKAPANSKVITPLTTLMADGDMTAAQVATALGLPDGTDVTQVDPIATNNLDLQKKTVAIQVLLQQSADALGALSGDSSPDSIKAIYSVVAKSLGTTLKAAAVPLISTNGTINATLLGTSATNAVQSLKSSSNVALAAAASRIDVSVLASQFVAQAKKVLAATSAATLGSAVNAVEAEKFASKTNFLSIDNDSIELNGGTFTLTNFASNAGVTLAKKVSPLDTVSFGYTIKGTPIPANAGGTMTTQVKIGIAMSDTGAKGQVLEMILDKANISVTSGVLSVTVPADANLYAYGKTASGTVVNVTLTNIAADDFVTVTNGKLSFNAGKVLGKLTPANGTFSSLQNITGTFNLNVAVSNLNIAGQTATSVQGLSVKVTGTNQSMSGLGVRGKFTVQ